MKQIRKYSLLNKNDKQFVMPKGSEILTVQRQKDDICVWALVDLEEEVLVSRSFIIYGTGENINENFQHSYLATVQFDGYVYHVFELIS